LDYTQAEDTALTDNALDATSRRILQILATDGRASYQAIADEVGLSRPAVMERVKRLEEAGYIQGYAARLDRKRLGFPITAFVAVRYATATAAHEEPGVGALAAHPNVLECHHVAGEDCYILKVAAPGVESLEGLLRELRRHGEPVSTRTTIVLSTVFEKPGIVPVEPD
jgi:Lrp/AsnC family leucine-responsive transcriptional regulator